MDRLEQQTRSIEEQQCLEISKMDISPDFRESNNVPSNVVI